MLGWTPGARERRQALILIVLVLTLISVGTQVAYAHALLERSEPAAGGVLPADSQAGHVSLWFSEPVSVAFNAISVLDVDNRRVDGLDAHVSPTDPTRIDASLAGLAQGAYVVRWQATSADNHVVRGSYWFAVGFASAPPPGALATSEAPSVPPLEVAGRALVLAAILALAGATFFRVLVIRPVEVSLRLGSSVFDSPSVLKRQARVWLVVAAVLCVGQLLWAAAQAESIAGVPLPGALAGGVPALVLFGSSFGLLWWTRLALGLGLATALAIVLRAPASTGRQLSWPLLAAGALLILSVSLGSHAAAARVLPAIATGVDAIHLAAAAVWLGGLLQLACLLPVLLSAAPGQRTALLRSLVPRVSTVALVSVAVLVASGVFSAWEQVASFLALFETSYGQSLLLKLGLLVFLLATAAINLLYIRPRAASGRSVASGRLPRVFRRLVLTELVLGGGVLVVVGMLSSLPPPGSASLPAPIESARQAGDLRISLLVDPNWVGVSRFRVSLADQQGLPPADVSNVVFTFAMQGMNMGRTTVFATPMDAGAYEATGFYVGMPGISQVGVSVSRASARDQAVVFLVEVPDLSHKQFDGLGASLGIDPLGAANDALPSGVADAALGQPLFEQHCLVCHGQTGVGNGPAAASLLPPPSDLTLHARWHPDEQLYWFITHGVTGTAMPAWADQLSPSERRDIIGYLHELANAPTATPLVAPALPVAASEPTPVTVVQPTPPAAQPTQAVTAVASAQPAATAAATPNVIAGLAGRLAFGPDTDGNLWVWRFPEDKPEKLTTFGPGEYSSNPVWSPDGTQVAFSYYKLPRTGSIPIPDGTDLYLARSDGTQPHLLTAHDSKGVALQFPAWAPDGKSIYVSYRDLGGIEAHVDRVDIESGARTQVVPNAGFPTISLDGRKLAYATSPAGGQQKGTTLMWSGPDGEEPHLILGPQVFQKFYGLRISPDGQRLLFAAIGAGNNYVPPQAGLLNLFGLVEPPVAYADGEIYDLWAIDLDGQNLRRVTSLGEDLPIGAWSPDGQHIGFMGGGSANIAQSGLAVLDADGSHLRRLTGIPGHRGLDWTPTP